MDQTEDRQEGGRPSETSLDGDHETRTKAQRPDSAGPGPGPGPSCVSFRSDRSMNQPIEFKDGRQSDDQQIQHQKDQTLLDLDLDADPAVYPSAVTGLQTDQFTSVVDRVLKTKELMSRASRFPVVSLPSSITHSWTPSFCCWRKTCSAL
ncbi:uncharacterized protein V6R79_009650 [Siganus canaliculatus]